MDGPGWRWVFLLNIPLALVCVPVALRHVPESDGSTAVPGRDKELAGGLPRRGFDVLGASLGAVALALVTYALIEATSGSVLVWVSAVLGVAAGVGFVHVERVSPIR